MSKILRIGTRASELALWQAKKVQVLLEEKGIATEIVEVSSDGDIDLVTPLYEMGVQGVFTKTLDAALLSNKIDVAVHSYKDVPTELAKGIAKAAVLKRGSYKDVLVKNDDNNLPPEGIIATSSLRRKAQWLSRFPKYKITSLRGNINTRLKKLNESDWQGAIFAEAGITRIDLNTPYKEVLDWMIPAPAQGAVVVVCREYDVEVENICWQINDPDTEACTQVERSFLRYLMGGCSAPIGAIAKIDGNTINFRGIVLSPDGKHKVEVERSFPNKEYELVGIMAAKCVLSRGGDTIMQQIKNTNAG